MKSVMSIFPVILFIGLIGIFGYLSYIKEAAIPDDSYYVGSAACVDCHDAEHNAWHSSLHPKMMRKAEAGTVLADFSVENSDVQFDHTDAVWVIGSKWEQQYMGHDGQTETLLPGAWMLHTQEWNTKNWDGWQKPVPLQRCHGCHTVGLNVDTGEFVEPGIGCESCHGPSSWHVNTNGYGRVRSTLDAQVCGQCHSRGTSKDNKYFFPVGYLPGDDLDDYFNHLEPDYIQNSSQWWGNGRERRRHQEYYAWMQGGHANSLKSLQQGYDGRYGEVTDECLHCHAAEAALAGKGSDLSVQDVKYGITCSVCHYVHGDLEKIRIDCAECHGKGAYYHQPAKNADHVICPSSANVGCVNCHMPLTASIGGKIQLHTHTPGIVQPKDSITFGAPTSCSNGECHKNTDANSLQIEYDKFYVNKHENSHVHKTSAVVAEKE